MNGGAGKWVVGVLGLYAVILGLLFAQVSAKADASAMTSLAQDVREIRALVQQVLRELPRDGGR